MSQSPLTVGFIGAGQMATALAKGLLDSGFISPGQMIAAEPFESTRQRFAELTNAKVTSRNQDVADSADVIILAVKPQQVPEVLQELAGRLSGKHLVISVAAGVSLDLLQRLGPDVRIVRVMPNTPCLMGVGASAYACSATATEADASLVDKMLSTVGLAIRVPERQLDAVTGLSGSGPAYVYLMIEALSDGGVRMGLPRETATKLAAQTVLGAAKMVLDSGKHPGALKDAVASPGGTTIAGLHALEIGGVRGSLMNAVQAATVRSMELGRPTTDKPC